MALFDIVCRMQCNAEHTMMGKLQDDLGVCAKNIVAHKLL